MPRRKHKKAKNSAANLVLLIAALALAILAGWRIYQVSNIKPNHSLPKDESKSSIVSLPAGYALFKLNNLGFSFVYSKNEDPIVANRKPTKGVSATIKSRHFVINIWRAKEFKYQKIIGGTVNCIYDGALESFSYAVSNTAGKSTDCNMDAKQFSGEKFFDASSYYAGKYKFSYLGMVKNRQYFMEISNEYTSECYAKPSIYIDVCQARARDQKARLANFVDDLAQHNTGLFQ